MFTTCYNQVVPWPWPRQRCAAGKVTEATVEELHGDYFSPMMEAVPVGLGDWLGGLEPPFFMIFHD